MSTKAVLRVVGVVATLLLAIKAAVIGYYDSDLWWMAILAAVGVGCLLASQRMEDNAL